MPYNIFPGMSLPEMLPVRKVRDSGVVRVFEELPFAAEVDGSVMPGSQYTWVRFDDGSYWVWTDSGAYGLIAPSP